MKNKNYLGDVKWVLYQYICDMNSDDITIRCGNYAFSKLQSMSGFKEDYTLNLNGEMVNVIHIPELNKKQLIISKIKQTEFIRKEDNILEMKIFEDDVVLYFA